MVNSQLLLSILAFLLFLDIVGILIFLRKKHDQNLSDEDLEFVKYNFTKACAAIQKNYLEGIKKIWNTLEFILNKKKYKGALDEKIEQASSKFKDPMELKALRIWTLDLKQDSFIEPLQIKHFVEILQQEMEHLGVKI